MPELTAPTLGALIVDGVERLRRSGIPEPRRQALRLWADLTESVYSDGILHHDRPVTSDLAARYRNAVDRRARGEPLPHVSGWVGFRRLWLRSDGRALIPRPETEGLVDLLLHRVRAGRVADVGTGTGCIALSLALEGSFTQVIGVDVSAQALELARFNRELVGGNVALVRADLCDGLAPDSLDALVSNPPYLTAGEHSALDGSVRDWEPVLALVSGEDGMQATTRLLKDGLTAVRRGGWLALEVDCTRAEKAARMAAELGWSDVSVHVDLFGRERYLLARRSDTR